MATETTDDCGCEETYCDRHFAEKDKEMRAHFGLTSGMTAEQRRAQLEAMRPESGPADRPYIHTDVYELISERVESALDVVDREVDAARESRALERER